MQLQVKLVLLGESAVGKSSLVLRFVKNEFNEQKEATIGAAFLTQKCRLPEDPLKVIKFEIWDTAGQERFNSLAPMYYRNAQAAVVVYDVTKPNSFKKAKSWIEELKRHANPNIIIALAGNKIDIIEESKSDENSSIEYVATDFAESFAQSNNLLFYETSAKSGANVIELFTDIARKIPTENAKLSDSSGVNGVFEATELGKSPSVIDIQQQQRRQQGNCAMRCNDGE